VYLHFLDICDQLEKRLYRFGIAQKDIPKISKIKELILKFIKDNKPNFMKREVSPKCQALFKLLYKEMKNNDSLNVIIFVSRKYIARLLNKVINEIGIETFSLIK